MFPKKGSPKPTPAGPGGFDPADPPGRDDNHDGIFGKPVKAPKNGGSSALKGLKAVKR